MHAEGRRYEPRRDPSYARCRVFLLALVAGAPCSSTAQLVDKDVVVDIPGVGPVPLRDFPPEMRPYVRIPGVVYNDPPDEYGDLPPAPFSSRPDFLPPRVEEPTATGATSVPSASIAPAPVDESTLQPRVETERYTREEILRRMYQERAYPSEKIPEGAYGKAWNYIQQMQQAQPPAVPTPAPEPQSWLLEPRKWISGAWHILSPRPALAQVPPAYQWAQIGPAPLINEVGLNNTGLIAAIGLDPQNPAATVYVGTFGGGVWKTTNAGPSGTTWSPITDTQPSLQLDAVTVHPANSQIIFVGSGLNNTGVPDPYAPERSIGILRSTDGGSTWCQIGPVCTDATHCPGSNPDYTTSNLTVAEIGIENVGSSYRVWAATSKGLWFSDNAASQPSVAPCTQVTWTQANIPAKKNDGVTPDTFNHVFLSPSNTQVLYASVVGSDASPSHNGWWKTVNHNTSWTQVLQLSNGDGFGRAAIRNWPSAPDVIWGLAGGPSFCNNSGSRLYRTTDSGVSWTLLTTNVDCSITMRSIAIDPTDPPTIIALGRDDLRRSTNGTALGTPQFPIVFDSVGRGTVHDDHNALRFASHDVLFDGTDGGMWQITGFSTAPVFNNLNSNLANAEFYHGTIDTLNYGVSFGGTQDNSTIKGGTPLTWNLVLRNFSGDTTGQFFIDPTNSKYAYYATFQQLAGPIRTTDGGLSGSVLSSGLPSPPVNPTPTPTVSPRGIIETSLALDPSQNGGNTTLVVFSNELPSYQGQKVYRTTNANGAATWLSITTDTGRQGNTLPTVSEIAIAPLAPAQPAPSTKIFGATSGGYGAPTTRAVGAGPWRLERATPQSQSEQRGHCRVAVLSDATAMYNRLPVHVVRDRKRLRRESERARSRFSCHELYWTRLRHAGLAERQRRR